MVMSKTLFHALQSFVRVLVTLLLVLIPVASSAQNTTASVTGLVLDEQQLAVPGASVSVRDVNRGVTRNTTSGGDGAFEIAGLQPGEYRLSVGLQGFANTEVDVRLEVNQ